MFPPAQSINLSIILTPFFPLYPVSKHLTNSLALPCRAHRILPGGAQLPEPPLSFIRIMQWPAVVSMFLFSFLPYPPLNSESRAILWKQIHVSTQLRHFISHSKPRQRSPPPHCLGFLHLTIYSHGPSSSISSEISYPITLPSIPATESLCYD